MQGTILRRHACAVPVSYVRRWTMIRFLKALFLCIQLLLCWTLMLASAWSLFVPDCSCRPPRSASFETCHQIPHSCEKLRRQLRLQRVDSPWHSSHIRGQMLRLYKVNYFSIPPWSGNEKSLFYRKILVKFSIQPRHGIHVNEIPRKHGWTSRSERNKIKSRL